MRGRLINAMKAMSNPIRDTTADAGRYTYDYADLSQVLSIVKPALFENGLCLFQRVIYADGLPYLVTGIFDESDEMELSRCRLREYSDSQSHGSALTYMRRYELLTAFALAADDDDGAGTLGARTMGDELQSAKQFLWNAEKSYCWQNGIEDAAGFHKANIVTRNDYSEDADTLTRIARELLANVG